MATRFYFGRNAPTNNPTPAGTWDDATVTRGLLSLQKDNNATASTARVETSATTWDALIHQHSYQIDANQTISGTFDMVRFALESNADMDAVYKVHVWVTQGNTSNVRGTLLNNVIDVTEFPTTGQGFALAQQTLSSVAAQAGDWLVVEVGFRATNTTTSSRSVTLRHGGNDATDLTAGDTTTTRPNWCEFSHNFSFAEAPVAVPTKFYLGAGTEDATAIPPAIRGAWTSTSGVSVLGADALRTTTPAAGSTTLTQTTGGTDQNRTRLLQVYVSPPLNAGVIQAGNVRITGLTLEAAADQDIVWAMHLYLMSQAGDVRATLLNLVADPDTDNEWPITTAAGRQSDEFAIAQTAVIANDRIVLEVGGKQLGTPAASGSITIRRGGTGADAQVGDTDTNKPTWLSFPGLLAGGRPPVIWLGL